MRTPGWRHNDFVSPRSGDSPRMRAPLGRRPLRSLSENIDPRVSLLSLCLCGGVFLSNFTTETQRSHRDTEKSLFSDRLLRGLGAFDGSPVPGFASLTQGFMPSSAPRTGVSPPI